ncbi:MAG: aldo/keto reductase [Pseudomonadota bacterium]
MDRRPLGRTGVNVSALCLGTMMYGDQIDEAEARAQMDACLERGVDFFDTAELYTIPPKPETQGESERIVGRWMADRGARGKVFLATKVTGRSPMAWIRDGEPTRLTPEQINHAIERSLSNLQTDYIDLYQLHWPDRNVQNFGAHLRGYEHFTDEGTSFEETLAALDAHVKAGRIRFVGLSNETPWGTMKFLQAAEKTGAPRMASIQNAYNLVNRSFETGLAEIAIAEDIGLLAYSPMAQGVLSGKYLGGAKPEGARGTLFGRLQRYQTPGAEKAIKAYVALAREFGLDPCAFAMQFVTTRPFVTSNIFGATSMDQLQIALSSANIAWTEEMEKAVGALHAETPNPCP